MRGGDRGSAPQNNNTKPGWLASRWEYPANSRPERWVRQVLNWTVNKQVPNNSRMRQSISLRAHLCSAVGIDEGRGNYRFLQRRTYRISACNRSAGSCNNCPCSRTCNAIGFFPPCPHPLARTFARSRRLNHEVPHKLTTRPFGKCCGPVGAVAATTAGGTPDPGKRCRPRKLATWSANAHIACTARAQRTRSRTRADSCPTCRLSSRSWALLRSHARPQAGAWVGGDPQQSRERHCHQPRCKSYCDAACDSRGVASAMEHLRPEPWLRRSSRSFRRSPACLCAHTSLLARRAKFCRTIMGPRRK